MGGNSLPYFLDLISDWPVQNASCCHSVFLRGILIELHRSLKNCTAWFLFGNRKFHFSLLWYCLSFQFLFFFPSSVLYVHIRESRIGTALVFYTNRRIFIALQRKPSSKSWGSNLFCVCGLSFLDWQPSRGTWHHLAHLEEYHAIAGSWGNLFSQLLSVKTVSPSPVNNSLCKIAANWLILLSQHPPYHTHTSLSLIPTWKQIK